MSVTIRGRKFHYRFQFQGNSYSGVCNFCAIPPGASDGEIVALRKKALAFEAEQKMRLEKEAGEQKEIERDIWKNKTVQALVENYKYELTGGKPITLDESFELAMAKPARREARSGYAKSRGQYWKDFRAFMAAEYPEAVGAISQRQSSSRSCCDQIRNGFGSRGERKTRDVSAL